MEKQKEREMFGNEREGMGREGRERKEVSGRKEKTPRNREGEEEDEGKVFHERPPKRI